MDQSPSESTSYLGFSVAAQVATHRTAAARQDHQYPQQTTRVVCDMHMDSLSTQHRRRAHNTWPRGSCISRRCWMRGSSSLTTSKPGNGCRRNLHYNMIQHAKLCECAWSQISTIHRMQRGHCRCVLAQCTEPAHHASLKPMTPWAIFAYNMLIVDPTLRVRLLCNIRRTRAEV
jgi:hypothetical protein